MRLCGVEDFRRKPFFIFGFTLESDILLAAMICEPCLRLGPIDKAE